MSTFLRCPECGNRVIQKSDDGRLRVRTKILSFDQEGGAEVVCQKCGHDIPLGILPGDDLRKALDSPRLVVPLDIPKPVG